MITELAEIISGGGSLDRSQIDKLALVSKDNSDDLLYWANKIRIANFGNKIKVCSIVPGRLGGCDQDCAFCAQSVRYDTAIDKQPKILTDSEILAAAAEAKAGGVPNFGIVYSGRTVTASEFKRIIELTRRIKNEYGLGVCLSLGIISESRANRLAEAGADRYNHNLETSRSHFPNIVTTHKYDDRIATVRAVQSAGLGICCGGIFGVGESETDRVDMAMELRDLAVDTVPMNFLHPIDGTPLAVCRPLEPAEILRIIALYRFILPKVNLKIAGGRVLNLRDLQSWIFYAGATSILSGSYLTTAGRTVAEDMQMLKDLALEPQ